MEQTSAREETGIIKNLLESFIENKSVRCLIGYGKDHRCKLKLLIDYSIHPSLSYEEIHSYEDCQACALVTFPQQKKTNFTLLLWDNRLVRFCIDLRNIRKVLIRNKGNQPYSSGNVFL